MRVPKTHHFRDNEKVTQIDYEKPIIIPRHPVITNERQRDKLIKSIERTIRTSLEYKDLIKYLRENINMDHCEFFHNVDGKKHKGMIQIHHEPFDLYTLTAIVMCKQEKTLGYINELMIAREVMWLHYRGLVGLIPLSITPHELVHTGKLAIPLSCVYGRFVEFVKSYFEYIDPIYVSMLNDKIELTKKLTIADSSILNVRYIYTNVDGFSLPQLMGEEG